MPDPPAPDPVTVALAGDVHAEPPIRGVLDAGGNPLDGMAPVLAAADLAIVNVETAVGEAGVPQPKRYTFQAPTTLWGALTEAGIDVVSLANNHALDYGVEGLLETIDTARAAGLRVVGGGREADEAYAAEFVEISGRRIAVLGLTRVIPVVEWGATDDRPGVAPAYDVDVAERAVRMAAEESDHVLVMIHWGRELHACPVDHQRELAARLTDAGADVIAGHHPHVLQGIDDRDGTLVAYSLGNFVFYAQREEARQSGVLTVTLDDGGVSDWTFAPARIDDAGSPRPLEDEAADAALATVAARSPGGGECSFAP